MKLLSIGCAGLGITAAVAASTPRQAAGRGLASILEARQTSYPMHAFDQVIDHFPQNPRYAPHDNGTFKQRYYFESSYYEAGGPIFLFVGGETPIQYWSIVLQESIIQVLVQQFHGLAIVLENRYYGESYPFNTTTTDQLAYMTTEQTIADTQVFAKHVNIPGFKDINAPKNPWILYGGSLAGALTAFTMKTYGDTFYAGISSSGVIHAVHGYPQWYDPIQKLASQDCVTSINNIIDNMDLLIDARQTSAVQRLKEIFGLGAVTDNRDFAQTISFPLGSPLKYPTSTWQELNWDPQIGSQDFFNFCRNVTNLNPPANNTQADYELANYTNNEPWTNLGNYAAYVKRVILPLCPSGDYNSADCFGTQHPSHWADTTNTVYRSYLYTTCTEFGAYQVAYPRGQKSLVSRVLQVDYTQQWCDWSFPKGKYNVIPSSPDLTRWSSYGDLNLTADRLLYIDGSADVWLDLCYHSNFAPERYWTETHPEYLINGAGHIWDLWSLGDVATEPQFIREAHYFEIRTVERWLKGFNNWKPGSS